MKLLRTHAPFMELLAWSEIKIPTLPQMTKCCCPRDQSLPWAWPPSGSSSRDLLTPQTANPVRAKSADERRPLTPVKSINPSCLSSLFLSCSLDPLLSSGLKKLCLCLNCVREGQTPLLSRHSWTELTPRAPSAALSPPAILGSALLGSPFKYEKISLFPLKKKPRLDFFTHFYIKKQQQQQMKNDSIP